MAISKLERRKKIKLRIRKNVNGTSEMPRLTVFRSNKQIYAQIINDVEGKTLASISSKGLKECANKTKTEQAEIVGKKLAEKAIEQKIEKVAFDRNGYLYHGRVKALAEGAREGGLKF